MPGPAFKRLRSEFERLQALDSDQRDTELALLAEQEPQLAAALEPLLTVDDDAEQWFGECLATLDRQRLEELDAAWAEGRIIGPYRLERLIATGGMGVVYLARKADGELKRPVALKLTPPERLSDDADHRLRHERDLLAQLAHPNIARIYDAGVDSGGQPWFAMEYINGAGLLDWHRRRKPTREQCLAVFLALCQAVSYAHRKLIVHGDIKPGNIMIDRQGYLKLLDFGVARLLRPERRQALAVQGASPGYTAPEIKAGKLPDISSDIYSLGCVLRALLENAAGDPVPVELRAIVDTATHSDPELRYHSVDRLEDDVRAWLQLCPVSAYSSSRIYQGRKWLRRHRLGAAGGAAMLVLVLAFALISRYQAGLYLQERNKARQLAGFLQQVFTGADPETARGHELTARELLSRGVERIRDMEVEPSVQVDFLITMARTHQRLGDFRQAGELFAQAARIQQQDLKPGALERARLIVEIGTTAHADGRYLDARTAFEQALDLLREHNNPQARLLAADGMSKLGSTLILLGERERGLDLMEQALETARRFSGPDSPLLAELLNDAGESWMHRGRPDRALELLNEALAIWRALESAAGSPSPRIATLLSNIALMHYLQGRPEQARPLFDEALALRRKLLPGNHPDLAQTLTNMGLMEIDYGSPEEAAGLLEQALDIRRASLRPDHLRIAQGMLNLAIAQRRAGRPGESRELFIEAIERIEDMLGNDHPMSAVAHNDYGALLLQLGELDAAEREYRLALAIRARTLPENHPHQAWSLLGLGQTLLRLQRVDEALPLLQRALEIRRATLPPGNRLLDEAEQTLQQARTLINR